MQETEQQLRLKQLRMIVIIMLVIFVTILSYTIYWSIDYTEKYGFFKATKAEVVEQVEEDGVTRDVLKYTVDGIEYRMLAEYVSDNEVGDVVTIYYDATNPIGLIYSLDSRRIVYPILSSLFGVGCVALIVVYILIRRSILKPKKKLTSSVNVIVEEDAIILDGGEDNTLESADIDSQINDGENNE